MQPGGLGQHCKLPQRGLGRTPSRNRIRCMICMIIILLVWQPIGWISYKQSTKERKVIQKYPTTVASRVFSEDAH